MRFQREIQSQPAAPDVVQHVIQTWDGEKAFTKVGKDSVGINDRIQSPDTFGNAGLFNQCGLLVEGWPGALSKWLPKCETLQVMANEDSSVSWRFVQGTLEESRQSSMQFEYTLIFRLSPSFCIQGYEIDTFKVSATKTRERITQMKWGVDEWDSFDGMQLPRRATRTFTTIDPSYGITGGFEYKSTYFRHSASDRTNNPPKSSEFTLALVDGDTVVDDRIGILFTIGQSELTWDGATFKTPEAIMEHPGDRLGEIIRNSERLDSIAALKATAERDGDLPSSAVRVAFAAAIALSCIAAVTWWRWPRR